MIILDESRLTNGTLLMIAQDYEMLEDDFNPIDKESYDKNVEAVVNRFKFDLDEFKGKFVNAIMNAIRVKAKEISCGNLIIPFEKSNKILYNNSKEK